MPKALIPSPLLLSLLPAIVPSLSMVKLAPLFKITAVVPVILVPVGLLISTLVSTACEAGINPADINAIATAL